MKRIEIIYRSISKELDKLNKRLERAEKAYQKKLATAEKLGVADMDNEAHREWLDSVPQENGWIINKADIKKNGAWYDLGSAEYEIRDIKWRIEAEEKRMAKAEAEMDKHLAKVAEIEDLQEKEKLMALEFEQEQKEWAKDGITLEGRYYGETPNGKRFYIEGNNGFTKRSFHCFTLTVDGQTIFTSGEFWRCYQEIKNR